MNRPFYANNEMSKRRPIPEWMMEIYASEERSGEDHGQERYIDSTSRPPTKDIAPEDCVLVNASQVLIWLTYACRPPHHLQDQTSPSTKRYETYGSQGDRHTVSCDLCVMRWVI